MARKKGIKKQGIASSSVNSNRSKTGGIRLDSNRTQFKQKAFGGKEITKIFKESSVLRDAAGKFIDKPGQGEPPKYKALDDTKKRIEAAKRSEGDVNSPRFKQMGEVLNRVKKRQKAQKRVKEARASITTEERANDVKEMKNSIRDLIDLQRDKVLTKDLVDQNIKSELQNTLSKYKDRADRVQVLKELGLEPNQIGINVDTTTMRTIRAMTVPSSTPEGIIREFARSIGMNESQIARIFKDKETQDRERLELADKVREEFKNKLKELYPTEPEPTPEPASTTKKKKEKGFEQVEYTPETVGKATKLTESSRKATKSTLTSLESIDARFSELDRVIGRETMKELAKFVDILSFTPKDINRLQKDLLARAYKQFSEAGILKVNPGEKITWKSIVEQVEPGDLENFIYKWQGSKAASKFSRTQRWSSKRVKESSKYKTPEQRESKVAKAKEKKEAGKYLYDNDSHEKESKVKSNMKEGMLQTVNQVMKKAVNSVANSMRKKGKEPSPEEMREIEDQVMVDTLNKAHKVREYLEEENGAVENFQGRVVVNAASPYPLELIPFTPTTALGYIRERMISEVANDSDSSVSYVELLHGDNEKKITESKTRKFVYELHHIEQFMYRHPDGNPVLLYDGEKNDGSIRGLIQSDFNNLHAEQTPDGLRYYIPGEDGNRTYLARSPYQDGDNITISESGRVRKDGKDSVSPAKEQFGTDESYIDLRGSSHRNKEYVYSLIHPLTSIENNADTRNQLNQLSSINEQNGMKKVNQRYIDSEFISVGVGKKERDAHDKFRRDLMLVRRMEVVERVDSELAKRPDAERGVALGTHGNLQEAVSRETNNVKNTTSLYNQLTRLKSAYSAKGLGKEISVLINKKMADAKLTMDAANRRLEAANVEAESHYSKYRELIDREFEQNADLASDKFLKGKILDPKVWEVDGEDLSVIDLRNRILNKTNSFDTSSDVELGVNE